MTKQYNAKVFLLLEMLPDTTIKNWLVYQECNVSV